MKEIEAQQVMAVYFTHPLKQNLQNSSLSHFCSSMVDWYDGNLVHLLFVQKRYLNLECYGIKSLTWYAGVPSQGDSCFHFCADPDLVGMSANCS